MREGLQGQGSPQLPFLLRVPCFLKPSLQLKSKRRLGESGSEEREEEEEKGGRDGGEMTKEPSVEIEHQGLSAGLSS